MQCCAGFIAEGSQAAPLPSDFYALSQMHDKNGNNEHLASTSRVQALC